jgi:hypothetical protein
MRVTDSGGFRGNFRIRFGWKGFGRGGTSAFRRLDRPGGLRHRARHLGISAGRWKTYANEAMGKMLSVTEPDPNSSGTLPT